MLVINATNELRMKTKHGKNIPRWTGDNFVAEDSEVGFSSPEDTGRHEAPCSQLLHTTWQEGLQKMQKWRVLETHTPGQCCEVHSVAKFRFHLQIVVCFVNINYSCSE